MMYLLKPKNGLLPEIFNIRQIYLVIKYQQHEFYTSVTSIDNNILQWDDEFTIKINGCQECWSQNQQNKLLGRSSFSFQNLYCVDDSQVSHQQIDFMDQQNQKLGFIILQVQKIQNNIKIQPQENQSQYRLKTPQKQQQNLGIKNNLTNDNSFRIISFKDQIKQVSTPIQEKRQLFKEKLQSNLKKNSQQIQVMPVKYISNYVSGQNQLNKDKSFTTLETTNVIKRQPSVTINKENQQINAPYLVKRPSKIITGSISKDQLNTSNNQNVSQRVQQYSKSPIKVGSQLMNQNLINNFKPITLAMKQSQNVKRIY